jgi:hypothetical protein
MKWRLGNGFEVRAPGLGVFGWALLACSSAVGTGPSQSGPALAPGLADCSAVATPHAESIQAFVSALQHAYSYTALSLEAMNGLMAAVRALDAGDLERAAQAAPLAGYRLGSLVSGVRCYWLLEPPGYPAAIEQALFVYAPAWRRDLLIEAPHAHEDHNTDAESALLFERLAAKALVVSGSHRCVQGVASSGCHLSAECSHRDPTTGSTPAVAPADSDPAHSIHNGVYAVHLAFRGTMAVELQLHSNAHPEINGDSLISNGTRYVIPGTPADALYSALQAPDVDIRSCNDAASPAAHGAFCGEINTQSLASNGAADSCLGRPTSNGDGSEHRFVHLEQSNYRLCRATDLGVDPSCLSSVDQWAERLGAALAVAIAEVP